MNNVLLITLVCLSACITALSQILLKKSANSVHSSVREEYLNPYVIAGYIGFSLVLVLNVFIYTKMEYKFGVLINSLAIILVMLFSTLLLHEKLTKRRAVGILLIIVGINCFALF